MRVVEVDGATLLQARQILGKKLVPKPIEEKPIENRETDS
jgi:hypothetical protein